MKIPVKVYEDVTHTFTVSQIMEAQARGDIFMEDNRVYLVTII